MAFKKSMKKAWKGLTSEKARVGYMKTGSAIKVGGQKVARYFEGTNRALDEVIGTRYPSPGQLAGVALPKGYKIKVVPKIIQGPRGYSVFQERQLVRIGDQPKKRKKKVKKRRKK